MKKTRVSLYLGPAETQMDSAARVLPLAADFAQRFDLPVPREIRREGNKKPVFDTDGIHFSVSHSGRYWSCTVSDSPVGIDIQEHKSCRYEMIARRFFHPQEALFVLACPAERFFPVWTAKESYVKYTGEGITDRFPSFSTVQNEKIVGCGSTFLQFVSVADDYTLCLCTAAPAEIFPAPSGSPFSV